MKYERLTHYLDEKMTMLVMPQRKERINQYIYRLAELEDKIDDGRLVELPCNCKIGDLVYGVTDYLSKPKLGVLTCVEITKYCIRYGIVDKRLMPHDVEYVYSTAEKEAAEAKLKELRGD